MPSHSWMLLTLILFLVSLPLNLIQDLRKFKWVNMSALLTLAALLVISICIMMFKDLRSYKLYDPDLVRKRFAF